jgi:hypothetical protein
MGRHGRRRRDRYGRSAPKAAALGGVRVVSKSPGILPDFSVFLPFAGLLEARLEGFEPPTRGLGMRRHSSYTILTHPPLSLIYAVIRVSGASVFLLSSVQF